mmetsp:Transcript_6398/g.25849  ORF Transcript_6398/g.25849 Transcript_6398/m.25849 type:complete len:377 (+) Transcript_6398:945-2075(+)
MSSKSRLSCWYACSVLGVRPSPSPFASMPAAPALRSSSMNRSLSRSSSMSVGCADSGAASSPPAAAFPEEPGFFRFALLAAAIATALALSSSGAALLASSFTSFVAPPADAAPLAPAAPFCFRRARSLLSTFGCDSGRWPVAASTALPARCASLRSSAICPLKCWLKRSWLLRFSCGSTSMRAYFSRMVSISLELYWKSFEFELKITRAMSQSQSTDSSIAFFMRPFLRFVKVTWRLRSSVMRSMRIFLRPVLECPRLPSSSLSHTAVAQRLLSWPSTMAAGWGVAREAPRGHSLASVDGNWLPLPLLRDGARGRAARERRRARKGKKKSLARAARAGLRRSGRGLEGGGGAAPASRSWGRGRGRRVARAAGTRGR